MDDETEKLIKKSMEHFNEDLPPGVEYDGECYIYDEDYEGNINEN